MNVLITGSTKGLGKAMAEEFRNQGYNVTTNGRYSGDIAKRTSQINIRDFKKCNPQIIVNNAFCLYDDIEQQVLFLIKSINYFAETGGTIINVNSVAGIYPDTIEPLYAAAKHALRGYSESVKFECMHRGIRIIDVYPGAIGCGLSEGRVDFTKLIDPKELAEFIVTLCNTKSFVVSSIQFNRTNYG